MKRWERLVHLTARTLGMALLALGIVTGAAMSCYLVAEWIEELFLRAPAPTPEENARG